METVSILGTEYTVHRADYNDKIFGKQSIVGICRFYTKEIIICNLSTHPDWQDESQAAIASAERSVLRHEIVHAFLDESGLVDSAEYHGAWPLNEEMVDWIAHQGPKIYEAWRQVGAEC